MRWRKDILGDELLREWLAFNTALRRSYGASRAAWASPQALRRRSGSTCRNAEAVGNSFMCSNSGSTSSPTSITTVSILAKRQVLEAMAAERDVLVGLIGDGEPVVRPAELSNGSRTSSTLPVGFWGCTALTAVSDRAARNSPGTGRAEGASPSAVRRKTRADLEAAWHCPLPKPRPQGFGRAPLASLPRYDADSPLTSSLPGG